MNYNQEKRQIVAALAEAFPCHKLQHFADILNNPDIIRVRITPEPTGNQLRIIGYQSQKANKVFLINLDPHAVLEDQLCAE